MTFDFVDDAGHDVVDLAADSDTLKRALNSIINVDETKLHFDSEGLRTQYVDPENVMMGRLNAPPDALGDYDLHEVATVATNVERLMETLRPARVTKSDEIRLSIKSREMNSYVERSYADDVASTFHTQWKLIDPDSVREEPDVPDLSENLETVDIQLNQLHDAVVAVGGPFDHVEFVGVDDGLCVQGHDDTHGTEVTIHGDVPQEIEAVYSSDYLTDIADAVKSVKADNVTLKLGEDYPLKVQWERDDGVSGMYMLAPRVRDK